MGGTWASMVPGSRASLSWRRVRDISFAEERRTPVNVSDSTTCKVEAKEGKEDWSAWTLHTQYKCVSQVILYIHVLYIYYRIYIVLRATVFRPGGL